MSDESKQLLDLKATGNVCLIENELALRAIEDRVIILEDKFKNQYTCGSCSGSGKSTIQCSYCKGTGFQFTKKENGYCRDCRIGEGPMAKSLGYLPCEDCNGTGSSVIVFTEERESTRPTTGTIKSTGPDCKWATVGQKVIYSNMSGHIWQFGRKMEMTIRIVRERELHAILYGVLHESPAEDDYQDAKAVGMNV